MAGAAVPIVSEGLVVAGTWIARGLAALAVAATVDKVITESKTQTKDDVCRQGDQRPQCQKCQAENEGAKMRVGRNMGASINAEYQLKIANMNSGRRIGFGMAGNQIDEWVFRGVDFDGLWPDHDCTLVEAKGQYAQFLEPKKLFMAPSVYEGLIKQAKRQMLVVLGTKGQVKLQWHFMELNAQQKFMALGGIVPSFYTPL
jgi:hypothetical protein